MHRSSIPLLVAALSFALSVVPAAPALQQGRTPGELFPGARFDPSIPTQQDVVGFEPGARPLRHAELMRYLRRLAEASPRATLWEYARSHEDRELVVFAVSDPETIAGLDTFRRDHAARVDPRGRAADADGAATRDAKAVAWMAYGIHGDELSSSDAAAALAYRLVAGEDDASRAMRERLLVLIDPCENPDGRERFLAQTASFAHRAPNHDQEDLSHTTVWPWGRGNHYLFDLNRDWFSLVHPESARSDQIARWLPQLVVDSHEMGADDTYLFPPARIPFNPFRSATDVKWIDRFAADQAGALDRKGYPYYNGEWNEEFFPGYGSSWASYHGAVGILYEMSGTEGTLVRKRDGSVRTYPEAVDHQATSSWANLSTLAEHRQAILADYVAHRRAAVAAAGRDGGPAAWLLPRGRHPERTDRLATLLRRQGIEVLRPAGAIKLDGLRDDRTGAAVATPGEDLYLVRLDQPAAPLVRQLLDPHVPMNAEFFRTEREWLERGKGTRLYETTAWSLPLAWDVEAWWTPRMPGGDWTPADPAPIEGRLEDDPAAVAWVFDGTSERSVRALAELLAREVPVRVAERPFRIGGRDYGRGTVLVRAEGAPEGIRPMLDDLARRCAIEIHAVPTAHAESGPDLGGSYFDPLVPPRIGVLAGWPVSPTQYGALWHLLDEEVGIRFNGIDVGRFDGVQLDRYNVLVFPPAFGSYRSVLGEGEIGKLRDWIEAGGTVIGIGSGAQFLADVETGLTKTRLRRQALEAFPPVVLGPSAEQAEAAAPFRAAGLRPPRESKKDAKPEGSPYDVAPLLGAGARPFAAGHDQGTPAGETPVALAEWLAPLLPAGRVKPTDAELAEADARLRRFMPRGAFLRVELDPERWLTWGLPETELPALVRTADVLVADLPVEVPARFVAPGRLHLGGLLWPEAAGELAHTAYATREAVGRGQVVLFLSDPEFRGWTLGTRRLLVNGLLYGPGLGTRWSRPW